ncbi:MAG TPA: hypothetical protein VGR57_07680 [Ktedonobacterales bacterium]|nr:hypothetical protein [Ktedonobacterales bacterium]
MDDETTGPGEQPLHDEEPERMAPIEPAEPVRPVAPVAPVAHTTDAPAPEPGAPPADDAGRWWQVEVGRAEGDLTVRRGDSPHVVLSASDEARYQPTDGPDGMLVFARLPDGAALLVPARTHVAIRDVGGDLHADGFGGGLAVNRVKGDAVLAALGVVELGRVEGDLSASGCQGLTLRDAANDVQLDRMRTPVVIGRVGGDLVAHGLAGLELREAISGDVMVEGSTGDVALAGVVGGDLRVEGCVGELRLAGTIAGDLSVRLCGALRVDGPVKGDADVREIVGAVRFNGPIGGDLTIALAQSLSVAGPVGGDADVRTVAREALLRTVGGDLSAETIGGPLTLTTIGGDARVRTSLAPATVTTIGGDFNGQRAMGGVSLERVGGDATLDTPLAAGGEYQVRAGGDIHLRVRGEVNARFVAQTRGGEIRTRLPLAVERGRRRNLVGLLGRGDAGVTLFSDGGDSVIVAADSDEEDMMSDDFVGDQHGTATDPKSWEGSFGGHKFRVRWDPGATPGASDDPDAMGHPRRGFGFEWEHDPAGDAKAAEDFDRQFNEIRDRAEQVARRAAEQAQRYAERAARRARETDWESIGREVRGAIERAMSELERTVGQFGREFGRADETRREPGAAPRGTGAQRVRIERDEEGDGYAAGYGATQTPPRAGDPDAQRRAILEDLRAGTISLDEAERRLGELR